MTLILKDDAFGEVAKTSALDDAVKEPDFLGKAMKLFNLRERLWDAFDKTDKEIGDVTKARAQKRAGTPSNIAFGLTAVGVFIGVAVLLAPVDLVIGIAAGGIGIMAGLLSGAATYGILSSRPEREGREAREIMTARNDKMQARIGQELDAMDKSLFSKDPTVRDEFRSAFRHASLKMEVRENRIHRAAMEKKAQADADAASASTTAATAATIAAMNVTIANMSH